MNASLSNQWHEIWFHQCVCWGGIGGCVLVDGEGGRVVIYVKEGLHFRFISAHLGRKEASSNRDSTSTKSDAALVLWCVSDRSGTGSNLCSLDQYYSADIY